MRITEALHLRVVLSGGRRVGRACSYAKWRCFGLLMFTLLHGFEMIAFDFSKKCGLLLFCIENWNAPLLQAYIYALVSRP